MTRAAEQLGLWGPAERISKLCTVCGGSMAQPFGHTYVLRRQHWVKIGKSKHLEVRKRELEHPSKQRYIITPAEMDLSQPLECLAWILTDIEHQLHERWADCHVIGEWFIPDRRMQAWINRL